MLVLSRKTGDRILIGNDIAITIVRVVQGTVRVGIEAPSDVEIIREEIKKNQFEISDSEPEELRSSETI